jgi:hypothetical protein
MFTNPARGGKLSIRRGRRLVPLDVCAGTVSHRRPDRQSVAASGGPAALVPTSPVTHCTSVQDSVVSASPDRVVVLIVARDPASGFFIQERCVTSSSRPANERWTLQQRGATT